MSLFVKSLGHNLSNSILGIERIGVKSSVRLCSSVSAGVKPEQVANVALSSKYTYSRDGSLWDDAKREFYEENGFIVIRNLVPRKECDKYIERFKDIANGKVAVPGMTIQKDISVKDQPRTEDTVYKLQDLFLDEMLFEYCKYEAILDHVEAVCGSNIVAIHTMLINKPPDSGLKTSRHPLHQDLLYFPCRPENSIVAAWTALERVNRENGCLVALPGTHKGRLLEHDYPEWETGANALYHGVKQFNPSEKRVYLEMNPGDTVFFHPLLIHGSGANRSKGYRKAISCHYASSSDCTYVDVMGTGQEKLAKEILDIAYKRAGVRITDYAALWQFRSQLVRGKRCKL